MNSLINLEADWQIKQKAFETLETQYIVLIDGEPPHREVQAETPDEIISEILRRKLAADRAWLTWFENLSSNR